MKLWVDDERPAPEGWTAVTSSSAAIEVLKAETVEEMSLDYCLGRGGNGDDVLYWLKDNQDYTPPVIHAHSSSATARELLAEIGRDFLGVDVTDAGEP